MGGALDLLSLSQSGTDRWSTTEHRLQRFETRAAEKLNSLNRGAPTRKKQYGKL
jgi:hypothetical protein